MSVEVKAKKCLGRFVLDVEFELDNGITVLGGESGAGKTTTLRLISGILTPDEGVIKVGGNTYFDSSLKINVPIQQRRVGFVFQDYALFPHITAFKNISYGTSNGNDPGKRAEELLALFHIEHVRNQLPREMSGGEQQRVALARALASDPAIVLLDEPLSAVDVETRVKLLDEIELAQRQSNIPFIYVTHNPVEIERFRNQRVILNAGKSILAT